MEDQGKYARGCPSIEKENLNMPVCRKGNSCKLNVTDWLNDVPRVTTEHDIVEVRFKNTRKAFYRNVNALGLEKGDLIAVEASPGHDIGVISLTGELVYFQLKNYNISVNSEFPKVYRKAKLNDIEKWENAIEMEHSTMLAARKITSDLNLSMKIGDVEYQGDKSKAIFYYIAEERVDFRELIKVLAELFRVRIEMRQIGVRQEAGRIGGIGPCGRELCCSTFITNFVSVTTNAARFQDLSLNPQKLAGQCGKLKCCLNYELDAYLDAQQDFPNVEVPLKLESGIAYHFKTDVFRGILWYSHDENGSNNIVPVSVERVKEIIKLNKQGKKAPELAKKADTSAAKSLDYHNIVGEDRLDRFDKKPKNGKRKKRGNKKRKQNEQKQNKK
ncbi:MAG: regulatory iron-sulfur-containing complex subunit RicT [Bacteroidota bacterium]|nr:regulatory iron-sulfur-containing complex subunit RicT [Bacteroidota bacterium]